MYNFDKKDELYLRKGELRRLLAQDAALTSDDTVDEAKLAQDHEDNIQKVRDEIKELEFNLVV